MIDGTQFTFSTTNPKTYLLGLPCWEILVNEKTGQRVNDFRTANLRGLDMKLKPSLSGGYNLLINGSLHKYHNCGEHNADQFTFSNLFQAIDSLSDVLSLDTEKCYIHGLEIGINITLPYSPLKVLKNLVCYRSNPFTQISKKNARKGLQCAISQKTVKVYDKAAQSSINNGHVLRFEVHISKMQAIKQYGITTLSDLQNIDKVYPLVNVLYEALNGIIWTDVSANLKRLSDRELKQWLFYSNPKTWKTLSKHQRSRATKKWNALLNKYGNPPQLAELLTNTWKGLFTAEKEAHNTQPFYQSNFKIEAHRTATILPLECTVKRLRSFKTNNTIQNTGFSIKEKLNKRYCSSCGNDITHQKKNSIFCSVKLYGKTAKKCRNKDSNRRRRKKLTIKTATMENNYLSVTYTDGNGNAFTDILHPSELNATKEWLDRVQSIIILPIEQNHNKKETTCKSFQ